MRALPSVVSTVVVACAISGCGALQAADDTACREVRATFATEVTASDASGRQAVEVGLSVTAATDAPTAHDRLEVQQAQLDSARATSSMWQVVLDDQRCFSDEDVHEAERGAEHLTARTSTLEQQVTDLQAAAAPTSETVRTDRS